MKYLLILTAAAYLATGYSYYWAQGERDNFGAVFAPLFGAGISAALTIVYIAAALWLHRFW